MNDEMTQKSIRLGILIGAIFGGILGLGLGAIAFTIKGIIIGAIIGIALGAITGTLIGYLTARVAGTTGGVSIGAYTGMAAGGFLGIILGFLIPTSLRMSINTQNMPVIEALVMGRFETAVFFSFLLCILGMMIGAWVSGKNLILRDTEKKSK